MLSPAAPFHDAQEAALLASAALVTLMGGAASIFTDVPTNRRPPYVVHGQDEVSPEDTGCGWRADIVSTIAWWAANLPGDGAPDLARLMGAAILDALARTDLVVAGWTITLCEIEQAERYATNPDGSTRGSVALRYELTAA